MTDDPWNDPEFLLKPKHPDFWRLSQVVLGFEGRPLDDRVGVDMTSFIYIMTDRVNRVEAYCTDPTWEDGAPAPMEVFLGMLYMDAFALGKGYAEF